MTKADVQGRLNRETNPIPGERPGFNPQFIDSDGYATDVTPNTPFPSGSYVQTDAGVWIPQKGSDDGAAHVQLTGRNVLLASATGVKVSAGSSLAAISSINAENISGLYVLARSDANHRYRVGVHHHRETSSTLSTFSGSVTALPSEERMYGVSGIIKPVGYRFFILIYNEDTRDHIYDVEVRSE